MTDANSSDSPLDDIAGTVNQRTTEAFELLGHDTRLAILLVLWEAIDNDIPFSGAGESTLSFSELRERVGIRDSGQFNYHLDKLTDTFVESTEEGYTLATPAEQILQAVFAGALSEQSSIEGEPIEAGCFRCGEPMVMDYEDGVLQLCCTDCEGIWQGAEFRSGLVAADYRPPVGLENRTPQEFHLHSNTWTRHRRESMMEGVCPGCSGTVSTAIYVCDDHDAPQDTICGHCGSLYEFQAQFACEVCKFAWETPVFSPIFTELAVLAFFHDHGLNPNALFDASDLKVLRDTIKRVEVLTEKPLEIGITIEIDGDWLEVILDNDAAVIEVIQSNSGP